jgi:hypothetical protein
MDTNDLTNWSSLKNGPIEITVEITGGPRCHALSDEGAEGRCVCVDEALGDLPGPGGE